MPFPLKYNTASQEVPLGYFLDSTDGDTEETALTIANTDIKIWKSGATTLANKNSGGGTHISNGIYYATLDATDTDTYGPLVIFVHVTGALAVRLECIVMEADAYDALYAASGTGVIESDLRQMGGVAQSATDLKDFADAGYDPATNKVQGVVLVDTTTTNTDMRGTDSAALASVATEARLAELDAANLPTDIADVPTVAEFNARTLVSGSYFDPAADTVTVGTNNDKTGYALTQAFPTNFSSMTISGTGEVDSLVQGYLDTTLTETSAGRIAGNVKVFWDNADALTTKVVDNVGAGSGGGTDWTATELANIRYRLGINGTQTAPTSNVPLLPVRLDAQGKLDVNAEADTALADYGANTVVPDPAGTAPTAVEIRQEMDSSSTDLNTIITHLTDIKGGTWNSSTDTLEAIRDRGDAAWTTATSVTVSDKTGFSIAGTKTTLDALNDFDPTAQLTEGYAADGTAPTMEQFLFMIWSSLSEFAISGTTITAKKLDGTSTAMTFTLDSDTAPTSRTRDT